MNYEQWMAALCIWREARGASHEAMLSIYRVILNRRADSGHRWPRSVPGVIVQPKQFSSFNADDANAAKFPMPPNTGTIPSADWKAFQDICLIVAQHDLAEISSDITKGANHYESIADPAKRPSWCDPSKITLTLEPFRFYKL